MLGSTLIWGSLLLLVWLVLAPGAWLGGIVAVGVGLALRAYAGTSPPTGLRPWRLVGFVPFFLWQCVRGAWDVAYRALSPGLPVSPFIVTHRMRLPPGAARVFLSSALSLPPGTFAADQRGDLLLVHCLSDDVDSEARIRTFERRVGRIFGVTLS